MVDHSGTMGDGPVPLFACHLLLCEVGTVHLVESAPDVFYKTVGALYFGRGCDDILFFVVDPSEALAPHEFLVKVGMEATGGSAYVRAELGEIIDNII